MHCYSYDGCDSDSPESGPLSGSDSEASSPQSQRSLVILLDDDDDENDGCEQPVHPVPSHRPKRPLPRSFSRSYHSSVKEERVQATGVPRPEVYRTISCTPGLRDKSLEVRLSLKSTISHLSLVAGTPGGMLFPEPRRDKGTSQASRQRNESNPSQLFTLARAGRNHGIFSRSGEAPRVSSSLPNLSAAFSPSRPSTTSEWMTEVIYVPFHGRSAFI